MRGKALKLLGNYVRLVGTCIGAAGNDQKRRNNYALLNAASPMVVTSRPPRRDASPMCLFVTAAVSGRSLPLRVIEERA